ncbi:methyltransferase [Paraoerskovia sediminicola]|uniref:Methyltransferase n=1 Tax=Paraoerskovia sediminicola TaxID=1138587 RepID=A0ABM8G1D2_9CELL|nr:class I SAM-dependent methyltransferase [Paraoerskovia sediminicola]BDZ41834.1 methyltransferase [Paraoerskovia sediminicola]
MTPDVGHQAHETTGATTDATAHHDIPGGGSPFDRPRWDQAFWDERYAEQARIWSGEPNAALVREVAALSPGRALDLGCGEGGDVIWLARRGWSVTGVDISQVALDRAATHAAEAGVEVRLERHTLGETFPAGAFDLVSAQFFYVDEDSDRDAVLRRAAASVVPGGVLLVVGHGPFPDWLENPPDIDMPTAAEALAGLALPEDAWETLRCLDHEDEVSPGPDGEPRTRLNNTLMLRRRP